jgi:hypothetical protein
MLYLSNISSYNKFLEKAKKNIQWPEIHLLGVPQKAQSAAVL